MALYRIDGWDYYPAAGQNIQPNAVADGWFDNVAAMASYAGRFGGNSIGFSGGAGQSFGEALGKRFTTATTIIGQALFIPQGSGNTLNMGWCDFEGGIGSNFYLTFEDFGVIRLWRCGAPGVFQSPTLLATTPAKSFHDAEWNYIEVKSKIADAGGLVEVRVNTVTVISFVGRTTNTTTSTTTPLAVLGMTPGYDSLYFSCNNMLPRWDDRYILDDTGAHNTTYLGNVRVNCQLTVGAGDLTEMDVFGAASNWDAVNEAVLTDVEYVYTSVTGERDLYAMNPNVTAQNILGVQVVGAHRQDDATQLKSNTLIKTGGTIYAGVDNFLAQNYHYYRDIYDINPQTGVGWTAANLNAIQAGQKMVVA